MWITEEFERYLSLDRQFQCLIFIVQCEASNINGKVIQLKILWRTERSNKNMLPFSNYSVAQLIVITFITSTIVLFLFSIIIAYLFMEYKASR